MVFANHPGGTNDSSEMRPGYWYGNGVMPAISQENGILLAIYVIPKDHPIPFTHVFWPEVRFDRFVREAHWLYGQKAKGYMALWCSGTLEAYDDQLFNCEYRCYEDSAAYFCICGSRGEFESLEAFIEYAQKQNPVYDKETKTLRAASLSLVYEAETHRTQYI